MPRLIYDDTGTEVKVGDTVTLRDGEQWNVDFFREPHKPESSGKVTCQKVGTAYVQEFYVGVIGATWVERTDRG